MMIELKKEFKKKVGKFTQLFKDERVTIYSVEQKHADDDGTLLWYEVFRPTVRKGNNFTNNEDFEKYPSNEDFGKWAWSCSNLKCVRKTLINHFAECDADAIIAQLGYR